MPGILRSLWNEPGPPRPPARVWRDWVLVAVLVPVTLAEGALRADVPWRPLALAIAVGMVPTVLWRRTRPLAMVAIVFGATCLASLATGVDLPGLDSFVFVLLLPYALFRWGSGRAVVLGSAIMLGHLAVWIGLLRAPAGDALGGLAILAAVSASGAAFRYRAHARSRELDQVKLVERERLARDLHDTVAHHVSAMAIRAQAGLATSATHPEAAADALRVIEAEASRALAEMRAMVRVLRTDQPTELSPGPRVTDLAQLAAPADGSPAVDVELAGDLDGLSPAVGAALYRLAQEAVTNARRHARHATRIEVRVCVDERFARLRVSDDGDTAATKPAAPPGFGLVGMIERANLLGGTCEAGPGPDRGWTVTAALPRAGAPA
ncbi:sensor histidine kinase [Micromonospora sp. DT233]|uniref:sensor histidine kinase n=1 Tax=Micromonospora sp. DT233 TaxID=3393432 RepID=UPI003CE690FB